MVDRSAFRYPHAYSPVEVERQAESAPLWPAGHLPRKGGDHARHRTALILQPCRLAKSSRASDLPPCGGDVRQDRGGREGTAIVTIPADEPSVPRTAKC